jgi:hypothetical protein
VSVSYGECEAANGAAANAAYVSAYQQAAALGTSVFVSSGNEGAASCDANKTVATHGIAVSGFASTPYNVDCGYGVGVSCRVEGIVHRDDGGVVGDVEDVETPRRLQLARKLEGLGQPDI